MTTFYKNHDNVKEITLDDLIINLTSSYIIKFLQTENPNIAFIRLNNKFEYFLRWDDISTVILRTCSTNSSMMEKVTNLRLLAKRYLARINGDLCTGDKVLYNNKEYFFRAGINNYCFLYENIKDMYIKKNHIISVLTTEVKKKIDK